MKLITGYKGFIGRHLLDALPERIYAMDEELIGYVDALPWHRIEKVYHMGAISNTTETDISKLYKYNVQCTTELFEECYLRAIPIVYASSASVYGNSNFKGNYDIEPLNPYAMTKAVIDKIAENYIDMGADIQGLRFFNVYGEGEEHKGSQASPIHQFTKQAKEIGVIKIFAGSGLFLRDFVWVEDVVKCILIPKPRGIYDVGTSEQASFLQVAELIADKYNAKVDIVKFPAHLEGKYQHYTRARKHFNINFTSVSDYLKLNNIG